MTTEIINKCFRFARPADVDKYADGLIATMEKYNIDTPKRQAAFLSQLAHESGSLRYVEELATGDAYEGRTSLGNIYLGDGRKYKGRGLIQITGRSNYAAVGEALNYDFINNPEHLELPGAATMSAGWFWDRAKLNQLADVDNYKKITRIINGGYNGLIDRMRHWEHMKKILNVQ